MSEKVETSWGIRTAAVRKAILSSVVVTLLISLLLTSVFCLRCFSDFELFWKSFLYNVAITVILWQGNGRAVWWLDKKLPWLQAPLLRLVLSILMMLAVTIPSFLIFHAAYIQLLTDNSFIQTLRNYELQWLLVPIVITSIITLFLHSVEFFKAWRTSIVEQEELKREHLASQYETLKNQVNPHFLFNSLNVLSTLVHKDADLADRFIKQMSLVYRHVLETQNKEVISLTTELRALEAFIFMLKIRFNQGLAINTNLTNTEEFLVAPLALQMLVENAVKHNIVARSKPLVVDIFQENDYLVVRNNLQPKQQVATSNGIGLNNIKARYQYLAQQEVLVLEEEASFIVKLPLIRFDAEILKPKI